MNEHSLEQLLHEAPEPPMHVDLDHILHQGRTRQRRHRITALSALAATLILAIAATLGIQGRDTTTPTPAHHTTTQTSDASTSDFFTPQDRLNADQVPKVTFGKHGTSSTGEALTVIRAGGTFTVRDKHATTPLPVDFTVSGVLGKASIVHDGNTSIMLIPVPADTTDVQLNDNPAEMSGGATLPDGTHVAVISTKQRLMRHSMPGWFWSTSDRIHRYSTGELATTASLGSIHVFYFPDQKLLGADDDGAELTMTDRPGSDKLFFAGTGVGQGHMRWTYVGLVPRKAHSVKAVVPAAFHSRWHSVVRSATLPGTAYRVVGMSLTSNTTSPSGRPAITWVAGNGDQHTMR